MGSAWNQLEQMLTCAICLDKFKNPRLLPCQHSFCGDSCMDGLVDYARRQIKCPECRAEHRIPYQGLQNLPLNVTLIRFLELHSRITGDDTEPLPTFMEKCSICSEKIEGVTRCAHCEKKVCPECKEAHIDILRREVGRVNGQTKRCLSKLQDFREQIDRAQGKLKVNHAQVKKEIQDSCKRLIEELQAKQKRLVDDVDLFAEQEHKTLDKLRQAAHDELIILDSNSKLADERFQSSKYQWTDVELWELKEIYARAMEFIRLFDADLGDFGRKIRFMIIPEFDSIKKRLCELGELKFADSTTVTMAQAFQYCNAVGNMAQEFYAQAAAVTQQNNGNNGNNNQNNLGGYSLAQSNSNSNMLGGPLGHHQNTTSSGLLELPGMQNALMRSQSDHRLASQFQQRLKQQQREREQQEKSTNRYGRPSAAMGGASASGAGSDYDSEAMLRSRYAPPRSSIGSKDAYDLTRDWPRPSDSDTDFGGGSIQFKSAFMRRKGNQYGTGSVSSGANSTSNTIMDDDDDLVSEASYGGGARNVRFNTSAGAGDDLNNTSQLLCKLFDVKELEHAPFSGVPKLDDSTHLATRLHQMGAKAVVEKKQAEEEKARDKDLIESAKRAMIQAKEQAGKKQASEDEIDKQKRTNKTLDSSINASDRSTRVSSPEPFMSEREPEDLDPDPPVHVQASGTDLPVTSSREAANVEGVDDEPSSTSTVISNPEQSATTQTSSTINPQQQPASTGAAAAAANSRRNLYSQAITEKSRRQLASAIQEANANPRGRTSNRSSQDNVSIDAAPGASTTSNQPESPASVASSSPGTTQRRRALRSGGRSMSKQSSIEQLNTGSDTGTIQRRPRRLVRAETTSFQQQSSQDDSANLASPSPSTPAGNQSKNFSVGSAGQSRDNSSWSPDKSAAMRSQRSSEQQTANTTDDDEPTTAKLSSGGTTTPLSFGRRPIATSTSTASNRTRQPFGYSTSNDDENNQPSALSKSMVSRNRQLTVEDSADDDSDKEQSDSQASGLRYTNRTGHRKSREFLPNAVNKLLDRSAQIRRDSQEARGRGDSPQRSSGAASSPSSSTAGSAANYYSSSRQQSETQEDASSSYPSRSRYGASSYQRQGSSSVFDDDRATSNTSVYTPNSSYQSAGTSRVGRKSSNEDDSSHLTYTSRSRKNSGGDSSTSARRTNYSSHRQESGDTISSSSPSTTFQSRFLSRSRTSSALADSNSFDSSHGDSSSTINNRSTISSRDRFLQSTNAALSSNSSASIGGSSTPTSSSLYSRGASSTSATTASKPSQPFSYHSGPPTKHPLIQKYLYWSYRPSSSTSRSSSADIASNHQQQAKQVTFQLDSNNTGYNKQTFNQFEPVNNASREDVDEIEDGRPGSAHSDEEKTSASLSKGNNNNNNKTNGNQEDAQSQDSSPISSDDNDDLDSQRDKVVATPRSYEDVCETLLKIGSRGNEPGQFTWPRGVVASEREILVADSSNHRIQIFDLQGKWISEFGSYGNRDGQFDCLAGVAICQKPDTRYVVSDRYNHRVQVFKPTGEFDFSFGEHGREAGNFNLPWGVCCSWHSDLIYVCDKENHRVQIFTYDGEYLSQLGNGQCGSRPGEMQFPHYIAATRNSKIAVTDTNNHRIQVFDSSTGQVAECFGSEGSSSGEFKFPRGIAIDSAGCFIVGDSGNNRVQIFDPRCQLIKAIGCWGTALGQFKGIEGVAVEPVSGRILVCDRENHRIQLF